MYGCTGGPIIICQKQTIEPPLCVRCWCSQFDYHIYEGWNKALRGCGSYWVSSRACRVEFRFVCSLQRILREPMTAKWWCLKDTALFKSAPVWIQRGGSGKPQSCSSMTETSSQSNEMKTSCKVNAESIITQQVSCILLWFLWFQQHSAPETSSTCPFPNSLHTE